ncbi:hypothetical protein CEG14_05535 [Bordetella genomosp. 1]|uniref:Uncharacterized protein n=1 Tax=Bordetella genomosp. 1 TaxID=1395607 RepID=A0A261SNN0_9BORD|nr:hypothetical protein [Bordetella genomosp. 1]OZI38998.1 hypothetical protein CEG14_05535 [Bordetella genomosp. 1]
MTTKHTPGPWARDIGSGFGCDVRAENGRKVAATWGINSGDPHRPAYRAECDANARLIAAAPELLEALQELADDIADRFDMDSPSTNPGIKHCIKQARAAILKATGEQA